MARYRKERRKRRARLDAKRIARSDAERIARKRDKAWRKRIQRERRARLPPAAFGRRSLLERFIDWLLGDD